MFAFKFSFGVLFLGLGMFCAWVFFNLLAVPAYILDSYFSGVQDPFNSDWALGTVLFLLFLAVVMFVSSCIFPNGLKLLHVMSDLGGLLCMLFMSAGSLWAYGEFTDWSHWRFLCIDAGSFVAAALVTATGIRLSLRFPRLPKQNEEGKEPPH